MKSRIVSMKEIREHPNKSFAPEDYIEGGEGGNVTVTTNQELLDYLSELAPELTNPELKQILVDRVKETALINNMDPKPLMNILISDSRGKEVD
jgi:hypothetical protein